jgi:hypothetical protein
VRNRATILRVNRSSSATFSGFLCLLPLRSVRSRGINSAIFFMSYSVATIDHNERRKLAKRLSLGAATRDWHPVAEQVRDGCRRQGVGGLILGDCLQGLKESDARTRVRPE